MVLLLGVTGYLNIMLNSGVKKPDDSTTTTTSYFTAYRTDRETTRDQEMLSLEATVQQQRLKQMQNKQDLIL